MRILTRYPLIALACLVAGAGVLSARVAAQETYASISTAHFEFKYQRGVAEADVRQLVDFIQNDYKYLVDKLGIELPKKLEVHIYESIGKFSEETNLKQPWRIAYYAHGVLYIRPPRSVTRRRYLDQAVSYETVLALLEQKGTQGCPAWLIKAFAVNHDGEMENLTPAQNVRYSSFADLSQDVQEYQDPPQRDDVHYLLGKDENETVKILTK